MSSSAVASTAQDQPPPRVVVEFTPDHQQALIRLNGSLDIDTAEWIRDAVRFALADGCALLHLDVSGVTFLDMSCFRQLLAAQHHVQGAHIAFTVSASAPAIHRMSEILGIRLGSITGETAT